MKQITVFAGPNGSGKTTITKKFINNLSQTLYVNADELQREFKCSESEAADIACNTREKLLAEGYDFIFETVMSTTTNFDLLVRAMRRGYYISCYYVLTNDPRINIQRVTDRVAKGGHGVAETTIFDRYVRALTILPTLFSICNEIYVFDNSLDISKIECNSMIVRCNDCNLKNLEIFPNKSWSEEMLKNLILGKYPTKYILKHNEY